MINREITDKIIHWLGKEKILILKGSRQVGKTTLLKYLKTYLEKNQPGAKVIYLQADDIKNEQIFKSPAALELYLSQNSDFPRKYTFVMIDEFQVIKQAGIFLKNIFDQYKKNVQFIVSGSSSLEITKNTEFLTGRALDFNIERINFKEYFDYFYSSQTKTIPLDNIAEIKLFHETFSSRIDHILKEYLVFGGYPEVITTKNAADKETILESIVKKYIEKDITEFLKLENVSAFNNLIKVLSDKTGTLVNKGELSSTINVSFLTISRYLDILTGTYVIDLVSPYFKNIRNEISKMPKAYLLDFGLRSYLLKTFALENIIDGSLIENFAYLAFLSKIKKDRIHFYRTTAGTEIDFVLENSKGGLDLCEVKYRSKITMPVNMRNFQKRYPELVNRNIIVTKDILKKEKNNYFIPITILPFVEL
jgi:predicted AAA+ superfamily ATPase